MSAREAPAPHEPLSRRIVLNTAVNAAGRAWLIATNLLLTPLILSYVGQDRFGIWALFWTLVQWVLLLDLGLGTSLVKHFAECRGTGDTSAVNGILTTVLSAYVGLGAVLVLLLWPLIGWGASLLAVPAGLTAEAVETLRSVLLVLYLMNLVTVLDALLKGFQRMDLTNLALVLVSVPNLVGSWLVLRRGWGLAGLVAVAALVYAAQLALLATFARRVVPGLSLRARHFRPALLPGLVRFGAPLQVSRLADLVSHQAAKLVLGVVLPIRYVTFYELGAKVALFTHEMPWVLVSAVFPAASELSARHDRDRFWRLYERGTKYLWLLTVPTLAGTWLTAHLILRAWLGHVSPTVYLTVVLLSVAYWAWISLAMVGALGAGAGWVTPLMRASLLRGGLGLALSIALVLTLGYVGLLLAAPAAMLVGGGVILVRFCREFGRSLADHVRLLGRVVTVNLAPAALTLGAVLATAGVAADADRATALGLLLACVALYLGAYLVAIRVSGILDAHDSELVGDSLPAVRWLVRRA